VKTQI